MWQLDTSEFVRLELLLVAALFSGLAILIPKVIKAVKGGAIAAPPQPNHLAGINLVIERLAAIDRRLERADDSRSKFHARIDKQAEALAHHERGCYERAAKTELRLGRIEDILGRIDSA